MHQKRIAQFTVSSTAGFRWTAKRGFMSKVWIITGASRGLCRAFTEAVLDAGDRVVATARTPEQLGELQGRESGESRTAALDVTKEASAGASFGGARVSSRRLDVRVSHRDYDCS